MGEVCAAIPHVVAPWPSRKRAYFGTSPVKRRLVNNIATGLRDPARATAEMHDGPVEARPSPVLTRRVRLIRALTSRKARGCSATVSPAAINSVLKWV
jgi:hypothetical protein